MSIPTQTKTDTLWRVVVILIIVAGALLAIIAPTITGAIASAWPGCQVVLFGILIAAIRSLRRVD
ncbi:hypothetical protein [Microbacterium sp. GXF0217]